MSHHNRKTGTHYIPLLMRARAAEQRSLILYTEARQRVSNETRKYAQLQSYGQSSQGESGVYRPGTLNNRQAFMSQLKSAIDVQHQLILKLKDAENKAREHWLTCHQETERYQQLINQAQIRHRKEQVHTEQKELDEIALQRHAHYLFQPGH